MEVKECIDILEKNIFIEYEINGQIKKTVEYSLFKALELIAMNGANPKKKYFLDGNIYNQLFSTAFSGVERMIMAGPLNRVSFDFEKIYLKLWGMELIEYTYLEDGTPDEINLSDFGKEVLKKIVIEK